MRAKDDDCCAPQRYAARHFAAQRGTAPRAAPQRNATSTLRRNTQMLTRRSLFGLALVPLAPSNVDLLVGHDFGLHPCTIGCWEIGRWKSIGDEKSNSYFTQLIWEKWFPPNDRRHTSL
jgi:hypothetical protein